MAEKNETNVKKIESLSTCPVCLDKFHQPKLLPCMHTFCLNPCLTNLVDPRTRLLKCPECRREHRMPAGGVQAFPSNLTMIGFLDIQTPIVTQPDRCLVCQTQSQELTKCLDCSKFICKMCRDRHLRELSDRLNSIIVGIRSSLPQINQQLASYQTHVSTVKENHESLQQSISLAISNSVNELRQREQALCTEAEVLLQSQLRNFRLQQEAAEVELATIKSFCESFESLFPSGTPIDDVKLADARAECQRYSQQIEQLQSQIPTKVQKLRFLSDDQTNLRALLQDFGRIIDPSREQRTSHLSEMSQVSPLDRSSLRDSSPYQQHYRQLEDLYYNSGSTAARTTPLAGNTSSDRHLRNHFFGSVDNPFVDVNWFSTNTNPTYRVNNRTNTSLSIFGPNPFTNSNSTSEQTARGTAPSQSSATDRHEMEQQNEPTVPPTDRPRRGTFVLEDSESSNLLQSAVQRQRDTVNIQELYNVRTRERAQTPVAFTIDLNQAATNQIETIGNSQ